MTVEGGTSGAVFLRFVRDHLCPTLRRGNIVVMDNLGPHHASGTREAIASWVAPVSPYSPGLNPIELCWSKLKSVLRTLGARTRTALLADDEFAATCITRRDARAWFRHCGYRRHQGA
jgi:transposase